VRLWDGTAASPVSAPLGQHDDRVHALAFSADGTLLASSADDGTVQLWNAATQQPIGASFTFANALGGPNTTRSLAFRPDGSLLTGGGTWGTRGLWDVTHETFAGPPLEGHIGFVHSLTFSPDGRLLASGGQTGGVLLWDVTSHQPITLPLADVPGMANALSFSPDGSLLASGSGAGSITLWDSLLLASGSEVGTITLWALAGATASPFGEMTLTNEPIESLAFSTDGASLTSVDAAGVVWRVDLRPVSWRDRACTVANRNLTREEWAQYIGDPASPTFPYHATCPELPLPVETSMATPIGETAAAPVVATANTLPGSTQASPPLPTPRVATLSQEP
jgi:WD40 repeat protein